MADMNGMESMENKAPPSEEDCMRQELENLQIQMNAKTDEVRTAGIFFLHTYYVLSKTIIKPHTTSKLLLKWKNLHSGENILQNYRSKSRTYHLFDKYDALFLLTKNTSPVGIFQLYSLSDILLAFKYLRAKSHVNSSVHFSCACFEIYVNFKILSMDMLLCF